MSWRISMKLDLKLTIDLEKLVKLLAILALLVIR